MTIAPLYRPTARAFVSAHHYTKTCGGAGFYFGLHRNDALIGVIHYLPAPYKVAQIFLEPNNVLMLSRLVMVGAQPNDASRFIAATVRQLPPRFHTLITYADPGEGHVGTCYRAAGWTFLGETSTQPEWRLGAMRVNNAKLSPNRCRELGATLLRSGRKLMFGLSRRGEALPRTRAWHITTVKDYLLAQPTLPEAVKTAIAFL